MTAVNFCYLRTHTSFLLMLVKWLIHFYFMHSEYAVLPPLFQSVQQVVMNNLLFWDHKAWNVLYNAPGEVSITGGHHVVF